MQGYHPLLRRQLRRHLGSDAAVDPAWQRMLQAVSDAYAESDFARQLVERALSLSSSELHTANTELRAVLTLLPDILFRVRADGQIAGIMQGSPAATHPVIHSLADPAAPDTPAAAAFRQAVQRARAIGVAVTFEVPRQADGCPYEVRLLPLSDGDLLGIARDITDRQQAENDRLVLAKLQSTGVLAGGIAHDFNNLLAAMLLNAQFARSVGLSTPAAARSLADIETSIIAAKGLAQQLLKFARGGAPVRQSVSLGPVLHEAVRQALARSNVHADVRVAEDLRPVDADPGQIAQVFQNLIQNAREAMPGSGSILVEAANVTIAPADARDHPPGDYVRILVTDEGVGIPAEVLPKIFDPYFTTKSRSTEKGTGLGLTLCHAIVRQHAGTLTVDSTPGVGTTVRVLLPAAEGSPSPAGAQAAAPRHRILIVDDEPMIGTVLKHLLTQRGYVAEYAPGGQAATDLYAGARNRGAAFDLVLLDLTIKGAMSGEATVNALRTLHPAVRIILMTGHVDAPALRNYREHGFAAGLAKPFDETSLEAALAEALSGTNTAAR